MTVDRLGDVLYLLQLLGNVRQPQRLPAVPRPGFGGDGQVGELAEPPPMSSKAEIRAFFRGGEGTAVVVSEN